MEDKQLVYEINKILTLEHGHLGMYRNFMEQSDKDTRRALRRFLEIEHEHIAQINNILLNLGAKPSLMAEGGDILGKLFGFTVNLADTQGALKSFSFIEKKSYLGYQKFVSKLETQGDKHCRFIAEMFGPNMVESKLMHLWHEDKLKSF